MPTDRKFDLGDYVEVKDRIRILFELYPQARLVTGEVRMTSEPDGVPRVLVQAFAYRSPDDPHPGVGWSWMELPGKTTYTRGSELENTETSAWGRAIASLGILVDKSIASAQEVDNKRSDGSRKIGDAIEAAQARVSPAGVHDPGSLVGIVEEAKDSPDFLPRVTPDGYVITFKLRGDRGGIKVIATSPIAEALTDEVGREAFIGQRVSCWGRVKDESYTTKAGRKVTYQVLELDRITGAFGEFTMDHVPAVPVAAGQEALFSDAEEAAIEAALP